MLNFGNRATSSGAGISGGGIFGQSNATDNSGAAGGLFGQSNSNTGNAGAANPSATTGGLFGQLNSKNNTNGTSRDLFGQGSSAQVAGSNLMGQNNGALTGASGIFGSNFSKQTGPATGTTQSIFGQNQDTAGGPMFGSNTGGFLGNDANAGGVSGTNLFGNANNSSEKGLFGAGTTLFDGQSNLGQLRQQQQFQSALNSISQLPINSITRIADLPPQIRQELEQLDQYFQRQVLISHHLKADEDEHLELIQSVPRDVQFLHKTYSLTIQSLQQDLKRIESIKVLTDDNIRDSESFSLILTQLLTPGTKVSSVDLNRFFQKKIQLYKQRLDEYFSVLTDIKSAINGLDNYMFGSEDDARDELTGSIKTGINFIILTVMEEFGLFMDIAERVAQLHQRVKEANGVSKNTITSS